MFVKYLVNMLSLCLRLCYVCIGVCMFPRLIDLCVPSCVRRTCVAWIWKVWAHRSFVKPINHHEEWAAHRNNTTLNPHIGMRIVPVQDSVRTLFVIVLKVVLHCLHCVSHVHVPRCHVQSTFGIDSPPMLSLPNLEAQHINMWNATAPTKHIWVQQRYKQGLRIVLQLAVVHESRGAFCCLHCVFEHQTRNCVELPNMPVFMYACKQIDRQMDR